MEVDSIKCRRLEIVDQLGRPRIVLHSDDKASVILLSDPEGPVVQISTDGESPAQIHLYRTNTPQVSIGVFGNGDAGLIVRDHNGNPKVLIGFDKETEHGLIKQLD